MTKIAIMAYVPVIHGGYLKFFQEHAYVDICYLIGEEIFKEFSELDYLRRKDCLRALNSKQIKKMIETLGIFKQVSILDKRMLEIFQIENFQSELIIMPDEDISHIIADKYSLNAIFKSVFLRWHKNNVVKEKVVEVNETVKITDFEREIMDIALKEAEKSSDWWRQVGGVIIKDDESVLIAHNSHIPDEQMPYVLGDPRGIFKKGLRIDLSTAEHAEAALIAEAAKEGISLYGSNLFITDFPCPPCAKLIAHSGIKKLYFLRGYSVLDGQEILKLAGVKIIQIRL